MLYLFLAKKKKLIMQCIVFWSWSVLSKHSPQLFKLTCLTQSWFPKTPLLPTEFCWKVDQICTLGPICLIVSLPHITVVTSRLDWDLWETWLWLVRGLKCAALFVVSLLQFWCQTRVVLSTVLYPVRWFSFQSLCMPRGLIHLIY